MPSLYRDKNRMQEPVRDGKIVRDPRQDGNVAVGGLGNLARWGPSNVNEIQTTMNSIIVK